MAKIKFEEIEITKQAEQIVNNSTTLVNDTELFHALKPNTRYNFDAYLLGDSTQVARMNVTFAAIAGAVYERYKVGLTPNDSIAFGTVSQISFFPTTAEWLIPIFGIFKTGPLGGTLQFQWSQSSLEAFDTKILEGSTLIIREQRSF